MRSRLSLTLLAALCLGACGGTEAPEPVAAEPTVTDSTVRVSLDEIADVEEPLPENVGGIDLGDATPSSSTTFCEAFGAAPARWVDDAVVPVQLWVDAFTAGRTTAPDAAREPIDQLLAYGQWKLDWNFKRVEERPEWTTTESAAAVAIADAAVASCDDLPLVAGGLGRSEAPASWAEYTDDEIAGLCAAEVAEVQMGVDWYVESFGRAPAHQQQIETTANDLNQREFETNGAFAEFFYFASGLVGVGADGEPAAVPDGACDL